MESSGGGCCSGGKKSKQQTNSQGGLRTTMNNNNYTNDPFGKPKSSSQSQLIEAKIVLLGDSGVGKSSIAQRFCRGIFQDTHDVTIGGAYLQQTVTLGSQNANGSAQQAQSDQTQVKMHIWDTGGSEKFRSMVSLYYKDAAAAIICYDVSDEKSFNSVFYWINEMINNNTSDNDNFVMALCGNKADLDAALKKISFQSASEVAKKHNMILADCSAKTGEGVQQMFKKIAEKIVLIKKMESQNNDRQYR
eukprot:403350833